MHSAACWPIFSFHSTRPLPCQCWLLFLYFLHFSELLSLSLGWRCWCRRRRDKFSLNKMLFSRFSPSIEVAQLNSRRVVVCFSLLCLALRDYTITHRHDKNFLDSCIGVGATRRGTGREEENKIAHASDHQVMCFVVMVSG